MSAATNTGASQSATKPHVPGEVGIWVFIAGDLLVFTLLFAVFMVYRGGEPALFRASQLQLDEGLGVLNTMLMLTSSLFVALAVTAVRRGMTRAPQRLYIAAAACAAGFCVVKYFEYGAKIRAGLVIDTNDFFMFYFMLTGIHLVHVVIGTGVVLFIASFCASREGRYSANDIGVVESASCFWHVVDLLWIVLFALLYLVH